MPDLSFRVDRAEAVPYAAAPQLAFKVRISNADEAELIHSVTLRCQVRIEPAQRKYGGEEPAALKDLFGGPGQWAQTLRSMLWAHTSAVVPPFTGSTIIDLLVPCTYDFNVAATKYFAALESGEVPLLLLFSGTIFHATEDQALQVAQVPWTKEAAFRLPVRVWQEMMEHYYPNSAWLCLRKDVFDRLYRYKVRHGLPTWEQALEALLKSAEEESHV
jgi:Family of unknown function (DUF6084)